MILCTVVKPFKVLLTNKIGLDRESLVPAIFHSIFYISLFCALHSIKIFNIYTAKFFTSNSELRLSKNWADECSACLESTVQFYYLLLNRFCNCFMTVIN